MGLASFASRAEIDLDEAVRWIAKDNRTAARALRSVAEDAARNVFEFPQFGNLRPELAPDPYRFLLLSGFPYLLVYNAARRPPVIMRVLHGARDLHDALSELRN